MQEQTTVARQLQEELDGYEWYEEDEEDNTGTVKANEAGESGAVQKANHSSRPPSSRSHHGGHSRPSSTRYKIMKFRPISKTAFTRIINIYEFL